MADRVTLLCLVLCLSVSYFECGYPPSPSGLSGTGSQRPSYPPSSGLSGGGSQRPSYPPSSGLSGGGSQKPSYPPSSGLSGTSSSGSSWSKPGGGSSSGGGSSGGSSWSDSFWSSGPSFESPTTHSWWSSFETTSQPWWASAPHSDIYIPTIKLPAAVANINLDDYTSTTAEPAHYDVGPRKYNKPLSLPSYYTGPEYFYIKYYRYSESRFSELLTGLALFNMVRARIHQRMNFHDEYFSKRYNSSDNMPDTVNSSDDPVTCTLRIDDGRVQTLKVPCEIVSTISEPVNRTEFDAVSKTYQKTMNSTIDPMTVRGAKMKISSIDECRVEIITEARITTNNVLENCKILVDYAQLPEPKNETISLPPRETLKRWLRRPPWWAFLFVSV